MLHAPTQKRVKINQKNEIAFQKKVKITPRERKFTPKKCENQSLFMTTQKGIVHNSNLSRMKILLLQD